MRDEPSTRWVSILKSVEDDIADLRRKELRWWWVPGHRTRMRIYDTLALAWEWEQMYRDVKIERDMQRELLRRIQKAYYEHDDDAAAFMDAVGELSLELNAAVGKK